MELVLHDITATAGPEEHCPDLRAGLEELGWVVLGRVRLGTEEQIVKLVKGYSAALAPSVLAYELMGATVLRDPDGTAFAFVDAFAWCPFTRLMTMLDDGHLVETHEAWTADPVQPRQTRAAALVLDRRREQTRTAAAARSIMLVDGAGPTQIVEAHQSHVARVRSRSDAAPVPHRSLPGAMSLFDQQLRHSVACGRRVGRLASLLSTVGLLALYVASLIALTRATGRPLVGVTYAGSLAVLAALVLVSVRLTVVIATRLFYVEALRPRFCGTPLRDAR